MLPVPMMNIINGGAHADNPIDIQEFMIMPVGADSLSRGGAHRLGDLPRAEEGPAPRPATTPTSATRAASRPNLNSATDALDFIMKSIETAGYKPGKDVFLALDCAATEYFKDGVYDMKGEGKQLLARRRTPTISPGSSTPIRSSRSRTACPRTTGRAGSC